MLVGGDAGGCRAIVPSWNVDQASAIIESFTAVEGAALPMLHGLQAAFGYVPRQALPMVADTLNISRAEIHGIVSFYHDFRELPAGRHVLKLCRAEACQSLGGQRLAETVLRRLAIDWGGTTADGSLTIDAVYCLGLCACAPAALFDGEPIGRLDPLALGELVNHAMPGPLT